MKKLIRIAVFLTIFSIFSGFIKDSQAAGNFDSLDSGASEKAPGASTSNSNVQQQEKPLTRAEKKAASAKAKEEKKAAEEAERLRKAEEKRIAAEKAKEKTDEFLGTVYIPEKKYTFGSGRIKIDLKNNGEAFNIYVIDEYDKEYPVFSETDGARHTYFCLKTGKSIYKLNESAGIVRSVRRLPEGNGQIAYTLQNNFQTVIDFAILRSSDSADDDIVKITAYVTNISKSKKVLSLKAIFDTHLGEGTPYHFMTSSGMKLNSERFLAVPREAEDVISTNDYNSVQFLLYGNSVSPIETVALANKSLLSGNLWTPVITNSRSFNSFLAYNNSAVGLNWPLFILDKCETQTIVFYIAVATDGLPVQGLTFIQSLEQESESEEIVPEEEETEEAEETEQAEEIEEPKEESSEETEKAEEPKKESAQNLEFVVPPITAEKLDYEYIQSLIDRIDALQSDPDTVDRIEVRLLNAELDAILEKIRQIQRESSRY